MTEEGKETNSRIMKEPVMTEEELVKIVNNQRNGKAAGVDGVKAELLKHLIKNKLIREHLLKCCNRCLYEDVQEDWLNSKTTMIPKNKTPKILEDIFIAVTVLSSKVLCTFYREKLRITSKNVLMVMKTNTASLREAEWRTVSLP